MTTSDNLVITDMTVASVNTSGIACTSGVATVSSLQSMLTYTPPSGCTCGQMWGSTTPQPKCPVHTGSKTAYSAMPNNVQRSLGRLYGTPGGVLCDRCGNMSAGTFAFEHPCRCPKVEVGGRWVWQTDAEVAEIKRAERQGMLETLKEMEQELQ